MTERLQPAFHSCCYSSSLVPTSESSESPHTPVGRSGKINLRRYRSGRGQAVAALPDVIVLLDVDLVKHHVLLLCIYVSFHLHGNVAGKH